MENSRANPAMNTTRRNFIRTEIQDSTKHLYTMVLGGLIGKMKILFNGPTAGMEKIVISVEIRIKRQKPEGPMIAVSICRKRPTRRHPTMIYFGSAVRT